MVRRWTFFVPWPPQGSRWRPWGALGQFLLTLLGRRWPGVGGSFRFDVQVVFENCDPLIFVVGQLRKLYFSVPVVSLGRSLGALGRSRRPIGGPLGPLGAPLGALRAATGPPKRANNKRYHELGGAFCSRPGRDLCAKGVHGIICMDCWTRLGDSRVEF